ncbi:MAG TPA: tetratricopeptide repeat protein [Thermoplasmata archaeon]|nr:tetratricopeptide repeat protein [Thermoplasmata archaeon]
MVLLRIWEVHRSARNEFDLRAATREGLAGFFSVSATRTSRDLKRLLIDGLVARRDSEVRGRQRRVVLYIPTPSGERAASSLSTRLAALPVVSGGKFRPLEEIVRELPVKLGLASAARFVRDGSFDRESCLKVEMVRVAALTGRGMVPPPAEEFVGRSAEIERLRALIVNRTGGHLIVDGIPGIGKTTTLIQAVRGILKGEPAFWYDFVDGANSRGLLDALGYYLLQRDRPLLEKSLSALPEGKLEDAIPVMRREFAAISSLLIFDNLQRADDEARELLGQVLAMCSANRGLRCVLVTRDGPEALKFVKAHLPEATTIVTLVPLARQEGERLWRRLGGKTDFARAWDAVGGHPHLLTLAASLEGEMVPLASLASEHLGRWLDDKERETLEAVSVFRHPVELEALRGMELGGHVALRRLIEKRFLVETAGGLVAVHDSIKEAALAGLNARRLGRLDSAAAQFWAGIGGAVALEEAAFHLGRSGSAEEARAFLLRHGRTLAGAGRVVSVESLLKKSLDEMPATGRGTRRHTKETGELLLVRASFETARGRFEEADAEYGKVLQIRGLTDWPVVRARVEKANVLQRLGRRKEAMRMLSGVRIPVDAQPYEEARLLHLIGSTYEALDELERAEKFHQQCVVVPSANAESLGHLGIGRVRWRRGDYEGSLDEFGICSKAAEKAGELEAELNARIWVSCCLAKLASKDGTMMFRAIDGFNEAAQRAESSGLLRQAGYAFNNLADCYRWVGNTKKAYECIEKASSVFKEINEPQMINLCKGTLANILLLTGDTSGALRHAEEVLAFAEGDFPLDFKLRQILAMTYIFEESNNPERARNLAQNGIELAKSSRRPEHEKLFLARLDSMPSRT